MRLVCAGGRALPAATSGAEVESSAELFLHENARFSHVRVRKRAFSHENGPFSHENRRSHMTSKSGADAPMGFFSQIY